MEREGTAAVDVKPCTKIGPDTMYAKIMRIHCLDTKILVPRPSRPMTKQLPGTPAFKPVFQGTPKNSGLRAGCDKFLQGRHPHTFRVLACLKDNRQKIRKVCLKDLEDHGQ